MEMSPSFFQILLAASYEILADNLSKNSSRLINLISISPISYEIIMSHFLSVIWPAENYALFWGAVKKETAKF